MKKKIFNKICFVTFPIIFLITDVLLKKYIHCKIAMMNGSVFPYGGIAVFKNFFGISFSINHICNKGAAWGAFSKYSDILIVLRIFMIIGLVVYFIKEVKKKNMNNKIFFSISLIVLGAIGNVIDFVKYGHVIDMLHFQFFGFSYPLFNIADMMIFFGCGILIFSSNKKKESNEYKKNKIIFNK